MASQWTAAAALLAAASATSAGAAPMKYDCDTAAGAFSPVSQVQAGPDYRLSGRVAIRQLRSDKQWLPTATMRIHSADGKTSVLLQLLLVEKGSKVFTVKARSRVDGKEESAELGRLGLNETLAFSLVASASSVRVEAGGRSAAFPVAIGPGAEVSVSCSTGEFEFEAFDLQAPAR